jgi:hypothetical protein
VEKQDFGHIFGLFSSMHRFYLGSGHTLLIAESVEIIWNYVFVVCVV